MSSSYITKNHKKFYIKIHLILVCKYRKKLLLNGIEDFVKQTIFDISKTSDFTIDIMETDKDHIHILLDMSPNYSIASIVNRIKAITTNRLWKQYGLFLKKQFWKERTFWSDGYFCCSIGEGNPNTIRKYIENQG